MHAAWCARRERECGVVQLRVRIAERLPVCINYTHMRIHLLRCESWYGAAVLWFKLLLPGVLLLLFVFLQAMQKRVAVVVVETDS